MRRIPWNPLAFISFVFAVALVVACGPASYVEGGGGSPPDASFAADTQDASRPVDLGMIMMPDGNAPPECVEGVSRPGACAPTGLMCTANLQFCRGGRWSECHPSIRSGCTEGVTDAGTLDAGSLDAVVVADNGPTPPANCLIVGRGATCLHSTECVSGVCTDGSNSLVRCAHGTLTLTRACPIIVDASVSDVNVLDTSLPDVTDAGSPDTVIADVPVDRSADVVVPMNCASPFGVCLHGTECYRSVCADGTFTRGRCTNGMFVPTRVCLIPDAGSSDVGVDVRDAVAEASVDVPVDAGPVSVVDDSMNGVVFAAAGLMGPIVITELVPINGVIATQTTTDRGVAFYEIAPLPFRVSDGRFRFQVIINGQPLAGISGGSCVRTSVASWWQFDVFEKRTGRYVEWYPEMVDGVCAFTIARWPWTDSYWTVSRFVSSAQYYLPQLDAGTDVATDVLADVSADVVMDVLVDTPSDAGPDARDVADVADASGDVPADVTADVIDVPPTIDTITVTGLMGWTTVTTFSASVFADPGGAASMICTPNLTMNPPSATCTGSVTAPFRVSTQIAAASDLSGLPIPGLRSFWDPGVWSGATCTALTTVRAILTGGRTVTCTTVTNGRGGCDYLCR